MTIHKHIQDAQMMESRFKRQERYSRLLLFGFIVVDVILLSSLALSGSMVYYVLGALAIGLSLWSYGSDYIGWFKQDKVLMEHISEERIGNYTKDQIIDTVQSVLAEFKNKEIPRVYIIDAPNSGPHVIDTYIFNFLGPINAVSFPRHIFHFLKPHELKAILAHELGHFYRYMYSVQRFPYPVYLFVSLFPFVLLPFVHKLVFVGVLLVANFGFHPLLYRLFNYKSKKLEYLCDLFAAKLCGKLNVINALLVSCKYSELMEVLYKKTLRMIRDDDSLSVKDLDLIYEKLIRIIPEKPNSTSEVDHILTETIDNFNFSAYNRKMNQLEISKEKKLIASILASPEFSKKRPLIDWDTFDFVERNHRVEEEEYAALIQTIQPGAKHLIDSITDDESTNVYESHPSLRNRILFLDKNVSQL